MLVIGGLLSHSRLQSTATAQKVIKVKTRDTYLLKTSKISRIGPLSKKLWSNRFPVFFILKKPGNVFGHNFLLNGPIILILDVLSRCVSLVLFFRTFCAITADYSQLRDSNSSLGAQNDTKAIK